jgi:hypothetical protein
MTIYFFPFFLRTNIGREEYYKLDSWIYPTCKNSLINSYSSYNSSGDFLNYCDYLSLFSTPLTNSIFAS